MGNEYKAAIQWQMAWGQLDQAESDLASAYQASANNLNFEQRQATEALLAQATQVDLQNSVYSPTLGPITEQTAYMGGWAPGGGTVVGIKKMGALQDRLEKQIATIKANTTPKPKVPYAGRPNPPGHSEPSSSSHSTPQHSGLTPHVGSPGLAHGALLGFAGDGMKGGGGPGTGPGYGVGSGSGLGQSGSSYGGGGGGGSNYGGGANPGGQSNTPEPTPTGAPSGGNEQAQDLPTPNPLGQGFYDAGQQADSASADANKGSSGIGQAASDAYSDAAPDQTADQGTQDEGSQSSQQTGDTDDSSGEPPSGTAPQGGGGSTPDPDDDNEGPSVQKGFRFSPHSGSSSGANPAPDPAGYDDVDLLGFGVGDVVGSDWGGTNPHYDADPSTTGPSQGSQAGGGIDAEPMTSGDEMDSSNIYAPPPTANEDDFWSGNNPHYMPYAGSSWTPYANVGIASRVQFATRTNVVSHVTIKKAGI